MQAIDPAAFLPMDQFRARIDRLIRDAHATPPAEGVAEVLVPGEPEERMRAQRAAEGIPFAGRTWERVLASVRALGIEPPDWR
jgi:uncharacterized oxidoreductase